MGVGVGGGVGESASLLLEGLINKFLRASLEKSNAVEYFI